MDAVQYVCDGCAVRFEARAVQTGALSEDGTPRFRDAHFAHVIIPGGSDRREAEVTADWLRKRSPEYARAYEAWKEGLEDPADGFPVAQAPFLTPSQVATLKAAHILSVQQLAGLADSALERLGPGFMAVRRRARDFLDASAGPGRITAEMDNLRAENAAMRSQNQELEERVRAMEAQMRAQGGAAPADTQAPTPPQSVPKTSKAKRETGLEHADPEMAEHAATAVERAVEANRRKLRTPR